MYAVFITGGKQYRAEPGASLKVEKLPVQVGEVVNLDQILMIADGDKIQMGTPFLSKGKVEAKVIAHGRHKKIHILKFRRRKHYKKQAGHRQDYTEIEITNIQA